MNHRGVFALESTPLPDGLSLIEASAGTGKTYTIAGLVLRALLERRIADIGKVLVVTFTVAATEELTGRIRAVLRQALESFDGAPTDPTIDAICARHRDGGRDLVEQARLELDRLAVHTIHGFCARVLEHCAFESGAPFQTDFLADEERVLLDAARDFWRRHFVTDDRLIAAVVAKRRWSLPGMLDDLLEQRRYPATTIVPEPAPFDDAVTELREAVASWSASFDDAVAAVVPAIDLTDWRGHIAALAGGEPLAAIDGLPDLLADVSHRGKLPDHEFFAAAARVDAAITALRHAARGAFAAEVEGAATREKHRSNVLSFDDLLRRLHDAICDPRLGKNLQRSLSQQYQTVLIDESQDTDSLQYEIFHRAFPNRPVTLIGDPKQAIYGFRGADVFAYLRAKRDADTVYGLDRNWRGSTALVEATNAVFSRVPRPFLYDGIPFEPVQAAGRADAKQIRGDGGRALHWWFLPPRTDRRYPFWPKDAAAEHVRRAVAAECVRLLDAEVTLGDRRLHPGDIAVLTRTNQEAIDIQDELRNAGVPSVVGRSGDVFASREFAELHTVLGAIHEPGDRRRLRGASTTELVGDGLSTLAASTDDDRAFEARYDWALELREVWERDGFLPMFEQLLDSLRVRQRFLALADGERRLTNLLHAAELCSARGSPASLLGWLGRELHRPHREGESHELRLERDGRAVQILTVHKSKGLEFEVVFLPFAWSTRRPKLKTEIESRPVICHASDHEVVFECGSPDAAKHLALADAETLAEELRLLYVAMTRARQRAYVTWGEIGGFDASTRSALAYVLHGATELADDLPATDLAQRSTVCASKSRSKWFDQLEALVSAHSESMRLDRLDDRIKPSRWSPPSDPGVELSPARFASSTDHLVPRRIASFTSLARGGIAERPDHDPEPEVEADPGGSAGMHAFARGARTGTCLHRVFELLDYTAGDEVIAAIADSELAQHGLNRLEAHRQALDPAAEVTAMVRRVLDSAAPGFALREVSTERSFREWPFHMPLGKLRPAELANVFARHAAIPVSTAYAPLLTQLGDREIEGYLTGFVDLIVEVDDRFHVFDWKSNYLGADDESYGEPGVWGAMCSHHYVLQYHLYLVALHRYVRARLGPRYDYDRHIGAAHYVFLRGVDGTHRGWFSDRPSRELIEALDTTLGGPTG